MFTKIMVPIDLRHLDRLGNALGVAADLAGHYKAEVVYVAVAGREPSDLGHSAEEVAARLEAFGTDQAARHGHAATTHLIVSHDPAVDLDKRLLAAEGDIGADLVVMQSHVPNVADYIWASHGGALAQHSRVSVMLVRG